MPWFLADEQIMMSGSVNDHKLPGDEPAAIDRERCAVHVGGGGRGEKDDGAFEIVRRAPSACRNAREDLAAARGVVAERLRVVRGHVAGRDGVDVDAERRELVGHGAGQAEQTALRGGVRGHANAALERQHRRDVDDPSATLPLHDRACKLAAEREYGAEVHLDHGVPILIAVVEDRRAADDPGVVDEDVRAAEAFDDGIENCAAGAGDPRGRL